MVRIIGKRTGISWRMSKGWKVVTDHDGKPLPEKAWKQKIHPKGPWRIIGSFDERATRGKQSVRWTINMPATTDLRSLVNAVSKKPCYGYFEGLRRIPVKESGPVPTFWLDWGT